MQKKCIIKLSNGIYNAIIAVGDDRMVKKFISFFLIFMMILTAAVPTYAYGLDEKSSGSTEEKIVQALIDGSYMKMYVETLSRALSKSDPDDLTIRKAGTVVENKTVRDIHITKEVGDGDVTLKNVVITGKLLVEGGGQNSIIIENSSVSQLTTNKESGKVKIALEGNTTVELASIKSNTTLEQEKSTGKGFEKITLDINSSVELKTDKKMKLSSEDKEIAEVDSDGIVTAKKAGSSVISAAINGKKTELCKITVTDPSLKTIKILSIGNSFSQDAVYYLYDIAQSAGINIVVGNLYSSGCSLERHYNYAMSNEKAYIYYKWTSPYMTTEENRTMKDALLDEEWDYITFQESSEYSGIYSAYQPYLNNLIAYVKGMALNRDVKLALNMTWAYSYKSTNDNFAHYSRDQRIMYDTIVFAYKQAAFDTGIKMVIPCGTAIQNARTNKYLKAVGNELTSDGYHLDTGIGRYIAGLTMFETIMKEENIKRDLYEDVKFAPDIQDSSEDLVSLAKKAVINAMTEPFKITPDNKNL